MASGNTEPATHATRVVSRHSLRKGRPLAVVDIGKREALKREVKRNTRCIHSTVYSQVTFVCKRISISYEEGKISMERAMDLIFEAHNQITHQGLPKDIVAEQMHKRLDKLEGNDRALFGIVMANTNNSVHLRESEDTMKEEKASGVQAKYSESYWADVI